MRGHYFLIAVVLWVVSCARPVPPLSVLGEWHQVQTGDTVSSVAAKYDVAPTVIAELNQLPDSGAISGRDQVFIPLGHGKPPGDGTPPPKETKVVAKQTDARDKVSTRSNASAAKAAVVPSKEERCDQDGRVCLLWPVEGAVTRYFGDDTEGNHDGIDIEASLGTQVVAADDGEVLYSGDAIAGYGNLILIQHAHGAITVYAHNDRNLVSEGEKVTRGQLVAKVGKSGAAKRTHLHFEVRVKEKPTDPMLYLPGRN